MRLIVGSKNLSSWSMRPYVLMVEKDIPFDETYIPFVGDYRAELRRVSPSGRVPVLVDGDLVIQETIAIFEYLHERFPLRGVWPADATMRAIARAISAEMHAGFAAMRDECSMEIVARHAPKQLSDRAQKDVARIQQVWRERLSSSRGPFLFGEYSAADAMYAPVATRFVTYGVAMDDVVRGYVERVLATKGVRKWTDDAVAEVAREKAAGLVAG